MSEEKLKKPKQKSILSLRGVFNKYADPAKRKLEDKAWEMHVMDKYKNNL